MAQGKLKVKTQLPKSVKKKKQGKGSAVTKRANRPIQPAKKSFEEGKKLKQIVTKTVNKAIEDEIRTQATDQKPNLSKAQQAVVNHHTKQS